MNKIPSKQNEPDQLKKLAAMRSIYSFAKTILFFQFLLSVPVAVIAASLALTYPALKGWATFIGLAIAVSNLIWLTPWQNRLRKRAAGVQESFDCYVLEMDWNAIKAGRPPMPELIKEWADKYFPSREDFPALKDWYPVVVGEIKIQIGRVICQRENCIWDSKQRHAYATAAVSFIAVCVFAVFVAALLKGLTVERFFLAVVGPLLPALIFAGQQGRDHRAAANRLEELRSHAERLVDDVVAGLEDGPAASRSRFLQDEILDSRQHNPPVFDWIFNMLRPNYESQMRYGAKDLVDRAKRGNAKNGQK